MLTRDKKWVIAHIKTGGAYRVDRTRRVHNLLGLPRDPMQKLMAAIIGKWREGMAEVSCHPACLVWFIERTHSLPLKRTQNVFWR